MTLNLEGESIILEISIPITSDIAAILEAEKKIEVSIRDTIRPRTRPMSDLESWTPSLDIS
jgi:hypothetical protein